MIYIARPYISRLKPRTLCGEAWRALSSMLYQKDVEKVS